MTDMHIHTIIKKGKALFKAENKDEDWEDSVFEWSQDVTKLCQRVLGLTEVALFFPSSGEIPGTGVPFFEELLKRTLEKLEEIR